LPVLGSVVRSLFFVVLACTTIAWLLRENSTLFKPEVGQEAHAAGQSAAAPARGGVDDAERSDRGADALGDRELMIPADRSGHFVLQATVGPGLVTFMVDTGATSVALSRADAESVGLVGSRLNFTQTVQTANGIARVAPVTLDSITVGQLTLRDVRAVVVDQPMAMSLLGMSFLSRLNGYEVRDRRLVLRW
jgi:aspartyl protease family protein